MTGPVPLEANQPADRFYRGGAKISAFRGGTPVGDRMPEDWIGSTTTLFGSPQTGLTRLPDGRLLRDAVAESPQDWLGPEHTAGYGADTMLLVKLLDAGQRLPVHVHPEGAFAARELGRAHGKAEAWYILEGGTVHLGFRRDVTREELDAWVATQDVGALVGAMHSIEVAAGDSVFVPPGLPHAIGDGVFLVEVQEPEDLSVLLEWQDFEIDGRAEGHLGLGFETALAAVDRRGWSPAAMADLVVRQGLETGTLAGESSRYFRAEYFRVTAPATLDPGFSVLVVTGGSGRLLTESGGNQDTGLQLNRGDTILVPHAAGSLTVSGDLSLVRCRPPAPRQARS